MYMLSGDFKDKRTVGSAYITGSARIHEGFISASFVTDDDIPT